MPQCRVFNCDTHTGNPHDISCHRFPKNDMKTAKAWLIACRIEWKGSLNDYKFKDKIVCGLHFANDDYEVDRFSDLMMQSGYISKPRPPKLKPKAVPTLNLYGKSVPQIRINSKQRIVRKTQKRMLEELISTTPITEVQSTQHCEPLPMKQKRANKKNEKGASVTIELQTSTCSGDDANPVLQLCQTMKPTILPVKFHDFPLRKHTQTQTSPPLTSIATQTEWTDSLLLKASKPQESRPSSVLQPQPIQSQMQHETPQTQSQHDPTPRLSASHKKDHTYYIPTPTKPPHIASCTPARTKPRRVTYKDDPDDEVENTHIDETTDFDYKPSSSSDSSSDEDLSVNKCAKSAEGLVIQPKFIVFESCLKDLISQVRCRTCGSVLLIEDSDMLGQTKGSMLTVKLSCLQGHEWLWQSQPLLGNGKEAIPAGNLLLSAAMQFSGTSFSKASHMASFMNLEFISESCKIGHERDFIFPVVHETWYHEKHTLWRSLEGKPVNVSGDGRCDSPGFSAKYCTYVMMDMDSGKVLDLETLSVNETSSSNAMEKEGCHRLIDTMLENNINLKVLCTDRHLGIGKLMREQYPKIEHQVDIWHLAKSVTKRLRAKANQRECQDLTPWIPSIRNHLWWAAASCNGDIVELIEKWRSVVHHVVNRHEWGGSQKYHECPHGPLSPEERDEKKWLLEGSDAHEALSSVINNRDLMKGIKQVNLFCHTGKTEVFNSNLLKFCPKRVHFPYEGMVVRTKLAALDNNQNTGRVQARVKRKIKNSGPVGSLKYRVVCPKAKKKWIAKPIYEKKNYGFVYNMMADVMTRKMGNRKGTSMQFFNPPVKALEKNIAPVENPGKDVVVAEHHSRFER